MEAARLKPTCRAAHHPRHPAPMLVFEPQALDPPEILLARGGSGSATSLSTKQEDKAVDNERIFNQIKSFDHWLFCVHFSSNSNSAPASAAGPPQPTRGTAHPGSRASLETLGISKFQTSGFRTMATTKLQAPCSKSPAPARASVSTGAVETMRLLCETVALRSLRRPADEEDRQRNCVQ